jgi:glycosyltransferase involved in cell wall biosynthesis
MSAPLFSIVTVTLDCAEAAVRTARSVLNQDFADYEYIVKDGGSQDSTVERLRDLAVLVHSSPDTGIYDAMNQALDLCSGQYVYFLNAGDTLYTQDVLGRLAVLMDPSSAIVYGNLNLSPFGRQSVPPSKLTRYHLFRKNLNHQAWMARLETYRALGGFDLRYRYVSDQDFLWQVVLKHGLPVQYVDVVLATFIYGGTSTCKSARPAVRSERWDLLRRYFSPWEILVFGAVGLYFLNPLKAWVWDLRYGKLLADVS